MWNKNGKSFVVYALRVGTIYYLKSAGGWTENKNLARRLSYEDAQQAVDRYSQSDRYGATYDVCKA